MQNHGLTSRRASIAIGRRVSTAIAVLCVLGAASLTGCGGSGSSGSGAMPNTASPSSALAINQSNATATAAEAMVTPGALNAGTAAAISAAPSAVVPATLRAMNRRVAQSMLPAGIARPAGSGPVMVSCAVAGGVTVVMAGTTLTVTFADCSEIAGTSVNGTQTYTNFTLTTTSSTDSISANVTDALTIVVGALSFAEQGDYAFALSADKAPNGALTTETFDLSGSSLAVSVSKSGAAADSVTLTNFNINFEEDQTVSPHQLYSSFSFTLASSRLNGQIIVTTTQEFKQIADPTVPRLDPYTGQLLITGADSERLQVTVLGDETFVPPAGEGQVELQLDPGSGSFGLPIWLDWAALTAAG